MLAQLTEAYIARDDLSFAGALIISYREGQAWIELKRELANVSCRFR